MDGRLLRADDRYRHSDCAWLLEFLAADCQIARLSARNRKNNTMNWLSSNWIWIALGVGALVFFASGRGGCGMGHEGHGHRPREESDQNARDSSVTPLSAPFARLRTDGIAAHPSSPSHDAAALTGGAVATEHTGHEIAAGEGGLRQHRHGC